MSVLSFTYKYSVSNFAIPSSTYRITDLTLRGILPELKPSTAPVSKYNRLTDNSLVDFYSPNRLVFEAKDLPPTESLTASLDKDYNSFLKDDVLAKLDYSSIITRNNPTLSEFKEQQSLMLDLVGVDEINTPTEILPSSSIGLFRVDGDDQNNIFRSRYSVSQESYDGKGGIDTFVTDNPDSYYQVTVKSNSHITLDHFSSETSILPQEREILFNVERIEFGNKKLAFDLDGNAGMVAKVYSAVLGEDSILDPEVIGSGLAQVDNGLSYENFAAITIKSAGLESSEDIVNTLWLNVVGSEPTSDQARPYIDKLDNGEMSVGELGLLAANTEQNETNIDLVGLQSSGIEFI